MYTVMLMTNNKQVAFVHPPCIVYDIGGNPFIAHTIPQAQYFIDSWLSLPPFHTDTYQIFKLSPIDPNKELS